VHNVHDFCIQLSTETTKKKIQGTPTTRKQYIKIRKLRRARASQFQVKIIDRVEAPRILYKNGMLNLASSFNKVCITTKQCILLKAIRTQKRFWLLKEL
jgi:hypothetical protein